jgi:hypothetical protein
MVKMVAGTFLPPGRRVDAVLVASTAVIPIEFKVGAKKFEQADYEQAWDYGLDLKNFHAPSHAAAIFPILCATEAAKSDRRWKPPHADGVRPPFCCNGQGLGTAIALALTRKRCLPPFSRRTVLLRRALRKWWLTPFPALTDLGVPQI